MDPIFSGKWPLSYVYFWWLWLQDGVVPQWWDGLMSEICTVAAKEKLTSWNIYIYFPPTPLTSLFPPTPSHPPNSPLLPTPSHLPNPIHSTHPQTPPMKFSILHPFWEPITPLRLHWMGYTKVFIVEQVLRFNPIKNGGSVIDVGAVIEDWNCQKMLKFAPLRKLYNFSGILSFLGLRLHLSQTHYFL